MQKLKEKLNIQYKNQSKDDDDEADGGQSSGPTSLKGIAYIKEALAKKISITDMYMKFIDDSKNIIED